MELETFVREALLGIVKGTAAAIESAPGSASINPRGVTTWVHDGTPVVRMSTSTDEPHVGLVEFDIAVTASENTGTTRGGGIGAGISVLSAKIGEETSREKSSSTASRLKFSIPVVMPQSRPIDK